MRKEVVRDVLPLIQDESKDFMDVRGLSLFRFGNGSSVVRPVRSGGHALDPLLFEALV